KDKPQMVLWDAATGRKLAGPPQPPGQVRRASFSPDGRRLLLLTGDRDIPDLDNVTNGKAFVWVMGGAKLVPLRLKETQSVGLASFSPDGRRVLTVTSDFDQNNEARVWDAATGRPVTPPIQHSDSAFPGEGAEKDLPSDLAGWGSFVLSEPDQGIALQQAAFSPDGRKVVTASFHRGRRAFEVRVWDAATGQPLSPPLKLDMDL